MSEVDEQILSRRFDTMRAQWRALRQAHERRALSPRAALTDSGQVLELQRNLEASMLAFAQLALEWVERGNEVYFEPGDGQGGGYDGVDRERREPSEIAADLEAKVDEFSGFAVIEETSQAVDEMQCLENWTTEEALAEMEDWPDRARVLTIEHIAARARALQDVPSDRLAFVDIGRITVMFGRMAEHLKRGWPGRAHGLARLHTPRTESWEQDARELLEELRVWRERYQERLAS